MNSNCSIVYYMLDNRTYRNELTIIQTLSDNFNITLFTNKPKLLRGIFPNFNIIEVEKSSIRLPLLKDFLNWYFISRKIKNYHNDFIFLIPHLISPTIFWLNSPVFVYVNQFGLRNKQFKSFRSLLNTLIRDIKEKIVIHFLKKTTFNFVVSQPIINILNNRNIIKTILTPHGIDTKQFQYPKFTDLHKKLLKYKEDGYFIVSHTGFFIENRGSDLILNAIKLAVQEDNKILLLIAGADDIYSHKIDDFAKQYNLQSNIINYGIIDYSLIPGILFYSNIGLSFLDSEIPAYRISPPQKVIEYYASGLPVICNHIETHDSLVQNGINGLVVKYNSTELFEAIMKLKNDKDLLNTIASKNLEISVIYDYEKIYSTMIQNIKNTIKINEVSS